jgi:uncharacterized protein YifE (UPF0438 family)
MGNENLYLQATIEIDSMNKEEALWAKSMALTNGDEKLARYKYINLRVANLELSKEIPPTSKADEMSLGKELASDSIFYGLLDSKIIEIINRPFNDFKNYPNGFSRSGDFSLKQSQIIEDYGNTFLALQDGINFEKININDLNTKNLLDKTSNNFKTWEKYIRLIHKTKSPLFLGGGKASQRDEDFGEDNHHPHEADTEIDNGYKDDEGYS